uniref:Uncharacterized protein n=1 Tax=viral metagenome TaxID=1070528 RepID=A0A6M3LRF9_9ZZZZ
MPRKKHNDYIQTRNELAKQAAEYADSVCGQDSGTENNLEWSGRWNRVYHDEITRLAKLKGWPA